MSCRGAGPVGRAAAWFQLKNWSPPWSQENAGAAQGQLRTAVATCCPAMSFLLRTVKISICPKSEVQGDDLEPAALQAERPAAWVGVTGGDASDSIRFWGLHVPRWGFRGHAGHALQLFTNRDLIKASSCVWETSVNGRAMP